MVPLLSKHGGQSFVETGCLSPHSSCGREDKWSKGRVLHLTYPVFIRSLFLLLMLSVTGGGCLVVGKGIGVEDTHIKKCLQISHYIALAVGSEPVPVRKAWERD